MKGKVAAIMTGTMLAMTSVILPASAAVTNTNGQHLTQLLTQKTDSLQQQNNRQQKWSIDQKGAKIGRLTVAERKNFDRFEDEIEREGISPSEAAKKIGNAFVKVKGTKNQYELRLSKKTRATFQVDRRNRVVTVLEVGISSGYV